MEDAELQALEVICIKKLAERFLNGDATWRASNQWELLGLNESNYRSVLTMMQGRGAIGSVNGTGALPFKIFTITERAVWLARQIEERGAVKEDRVEAVKIRVRRHRFFSLVVIAFVVVTVIATAITQIGGALKMLKIID